MHSVIDERDETYAAAEFARLTGWTAERVGRVHGGRNSRIYAIDTATERYALKEYFQDPRDLRKRYATEKRALQLFEAAGYRDTPRFLVGDERFAVVTFVAGAPLQAPAEPEIDAILAFVMRLRALPRAVRGATVGDLFAGLGPAYGGFLQPENLFVDVSRRAAALRASAVAGDDLHAFMQTEFGPLHDAAARAAKTALYHAEIVPEREIPQPCIISGDFGCHNIIRDGMHLSFVDFEYFGWDDPVKLAIDFLVHPASDLTANAARRFAQGMHEIFADDESFAARFAAYYPLLGLRWAAIALNEFVAERGPGREFAGVTARDAHTRQGQLAIARSLLRRAQAGPPL